MVPLPPHWDAIFGPLRGDAPDELFVVAQIGQSLDGRVATASGHSHYINGPAGLAHLHRLRAIVDAVVVGVGTALADDPQLTVRHVAGRDPARVVIDPGARLPAAAKMFARDGVRRLVMTAHDVKPQLPAGIEIVGLQAFQRRIAPEAILSALHERGLRRILIEGGAETVSRFLVANCLDRLHVVVVPHHHRQWAAELQSSADRARARSVARTNEDPPTGWRRVVRLRSERSASGQSGQRRH